jgi:DNA-binding response OmpR family regulator
VDLTANEALLLARLMEAPDTRVDREELYRSLDWPADDKAENRLGTLISRLRTKVSQAVPDISFPLRTLHGSGYVFKTDQVPKP